MADEPVFGVFKEEKGLFIGVEPYEKPVAVLSRHQGKQFLVSDTNATSGSGPDSWFDKNLQLATPSDSYIEPIDLPVIVAARTKLDEGATPDSGTGRPLHDKPFRPSNPAARAGRGSGSPYGTFGPMSMFLVAPDGAGKTRPTTAPADKSLHGNIYTNNPKRAGPGYPDQYRLISGQSFGYVPDEYQRGRILEKALKHEARARIPKPFWGGTRATGCFTPDSELYAVTPSPPPPRRATSTDLPWRPTNPPMRGPHAAFSSPAYIPCPEPHEKPKLQLRPSTYEPVTPAFRPANKGHKRLSMWSVNPYERGTVQAPTTPTLTRPPAALRTGPPAAAAAAAAAATAV